MGDSAESETEKPAAPPLQSHLSDTVRRSAVDVFLLGFFALVFTVVAFLKFFRSDI